MYLKLKQFIAPIQTLWARDRTYVLIFIVVNLIAGQVGVVTSLALTWQAGGKISSAIDQALSSGALYTFSISLVVSSLAMIASELIDAIRNDETVSFFETKIIWMVFAMAVLVIQAPLVGALLSSESQQSSTLVQSTLSQTVKSSDEKSESIPAISSTAEDANIQPNPTNQLLQFGRRQSGQVIFWVLSMLISLQLYCLYRIPLIRESHAKRRNEEVEMLLEKAENQKTTPFGEAI